MLKRRERYMKLYAPAESGMGEFMGYFPVSLSYRTSEEVESGDVLYSNLRVSVYCDKHRSPEGGFVRGMILESLDGGERLHVLVPVCVGRFWLLKTEMTMENGEGLKE